VLSQIMWWSTNVIEKLEMLVGDRRGSKIETETETETESETTGTGRNEGKTEIASENTETGSGRAQSRETGALTIFPSCLTERGVCRAKEVTVVDESRGRSADGGGDTTETTETTETPETPETTETTETTEIIGMTE